MSSEVVEAAVEQAVGKGLDLGVKVGVAGQGGVVEVAAAFRPGGAFGADGALAQEAAQQGLDGGGAPGSGGADRSDQVGGGERAQTPEGGQDLALRLRDAGDGSQGRSTARSMRASTAQLAAVATAPDNRPRPIRSTASARPGATSRKGTAAGALATPRKMLSAT